MVYCIGVDEAGYGPRLGPLVISATLWQLPAGLPPEQMYSCLSQVITSNLSGSKLPAGCLSRTPTPQKTTTPLPESISPWSNSGHPEKCREEFSPLVVADSKRVYTRQGRAGLERTVLSMLAVAGKQPACWTDLIEALAGDSETRQTALQWYPQHWPRIPESFSAKEIADLAGRVAEAMAKEEIRLLGLRTVFVFPERFNRLVSSVGNKATMLSWQTLELVKGLLSQLRPDPVCVLCDKHGGRNRYEHLISQVFASSFFQPVQVKAVCQHRQQSIYLLAADPSPVEFRFLGGGERLMPVALASMLSKYLRELSMEAWNRFWADQLPGIRPTAGYPKDARRFRAEIAHRQAALGIPDSAIWRIR